MSKKTYVIKGSVIVISTFFNRKDSCYEKVKNYETIIP